MLCAGLDLSRQRLDFHLLDGEGGTVEAGAAPPDADGLHGLSERLARHGAPIRAAIESMNGARYVHEFTSWAFTERARRSGLVPSMGSVGDCYDNAMIEAFWSRMQVELLDTRRWKTRVELANAIFEYIEIFHNRRRRHSSLAMRTPIEYELLNTTAAVA
jgi:putative transposase